MKSNYCLFGLGIAFLAFASGCASGKKVEFVEKANKIDVMVGETYFTSYLFGGENYENIGTSETSKRDKSFLAKPVLYPVLSPSGIVVTRGHPLVKVEGESEDHPHHVGVFFTYDEVNDEGFWNNTFAPPQIKHMKVTKMEEGRGKGTIATVSHWIDKSGVVLLEEARTMVFCAGDDEYAIDFDINLTAKDKKVVFTDTKEGMFAIRVAGWLTEKNGSGEYLSSNGEKKEKNVWGRRARWVRLQGEKDGKTIGVAILNHPKSVNYPTFWHARGYGLFGANPLGQGAFEKRRKVENPQTFNLTLEPGESALFKFRMIIYEGDKTKEQLEEQFKQYGK